MVLASCWKGREEAPPLCLARTTPCLLCETSLVLNIYKLGLQVQCHKRAFHFFLSARNPFRSRFIPSRRRRRPQGMTPSVEPPSCPRRRLLSPSSVNRKETAAEEEGREGYEMRNDEYIGLVKKEGQKEGPFKMALK